MCRKYFGVDVLGQLVVVDEQSDAGVVGCTRGEDVQSEVERPILRDVVVGRAVGYRQSEDALAVERLDRKSVV